jgi:hypothetical protein
MLTYNAELITGTKTADVGVKNAMMKALQEVVSKAGANMSDASKNSILALIDDDASDQTGRFPTSHMSLRGTSNFYGRFCGHHKRQAAWCISEGSPFDHCNPPYQVCSNSVLWLR